MSQAKKYQGIWSKGTIPSTTIDKELAYTKKVKGKMVEYYHCWKYDEEASRPAFKENKIQQPKISQLERQLGIRFKKPKRDGSINE